MLLASAATLVGSIISNIINQYFPRNANIAFIILLCAGIQLLMLGVVGKYISNIYREVQRRPQYIIAQTNKKDVVNKP